MISYSHSNIDFCRRLYGMLSQHPELSISFDINNGKYLWKEIEETIQDSDLILFLISNDFFSSKSCRQEFIYVTDTLKKAFIPISITTDYQITGWLKNQTTELKHIRFAENDFMNSYENLLLMINKTLSINISLVKNIFNIKQWFIDNNIKSELYEFYQFENENELLLYAQAIKTSLWTKEYERIKSRFEQKFKPQELHLSPHDFSKFINALERLNKKTIRST